jgi:hypothetical protein
VKQFTPSRIYFLAAAAALGLAAFSGWYAQLWLPAAIPAVLFLATASLVIWLAARPTLRVTDTHLAIGRREIEWSLIRRIDQTGWIAPLLFYLSLADGTRIRVIYPGDTSASTAVLRAIQQRSPNSLINGIPQRQLFGAPAPPRAAEPLPPPPCRILSEEEEAEIERMFHKLRTAGRLDPEK